MREIVLDTETTGLDPTRGDRLLEIGAIEVIDQAATGATFHVLLNPEREVSDEAFHVHGHSNISLKDSPLFSEVAKELLAFIANDPLVIHNGEFDMKFLNTELQAAGYSSIPLERVVDTLALARRKHPGSSNSLDALCNRYRIDRSRRSKHGALLDAELLVEVYAELCGGRQRTLALSRDPIVAGPGRYTPIWKARGARLPPRLGTSDTRDHFAHVKSLGESAIWLCYPANKAPSVGT